MHPLFFLAFATFILVIGFLWWNKRAVKHHPHGDPLTGAGGPNDPIAGSTPGLRDPGEMTRSMDEAAKRPLADRNLEYAEGEGRTHAEGEPRP
jgi:hypothetical protein